MLCNSREYNSPKPNSSIMKSFSNQYMESNKFLDDYLVLYLSQSLPNYYISHKKKREPCDRLIYFVNNTSNSFSILYLLTPYHPHTSKYTILFPFNCSILIINNYLYCNSYITQMN